MESASSLWWSESAERRFKARSSSVALLTAVEAPKGKVLWQDPDVSEATFIWADRKLTVLNQDENLLLAEPSSAGLKLLARAQALSGVAWTPPSIVGGSCTCGIGDRWRRWISRDHSLDDYAA